MKKLKIMETLGNSLNKVSFKLKKHSPEILVVAGVIGTVASVVLACKATTKISAIIDQTKENVDAIHNCIEDETLAEDYSQEDAKKDLLITYAQTGIKLVTLYAPAAILGVLSLSSIVASNNILRKRNVALAAAYATVDKGFKEYRNRVVDRFGKEIDNELRHNIKAKTIEETVIDEKGNEQKSEKTINIVENPNSYSDYARFFDNSCIGWERDSDFNLMFIRSHQNYANNKLTATGHLFLNEVYDMLGIPRTKAGQVVGWVYDAKNPSGDNYVDFGMYDVHRETEDGYEPAILLDFNVDGNIWDLM